MDGILDVIEEVVQVALRVSGFDATAETIALVSILATVSPVIFGILYGAFRGFAWVRRKMQ